MIKSSVARDLKDPREEIFSKNTKIFFSKGDTQFDRFLRNICFSVNNDTTIYSRLLPDLGFNDNPLYLHGRQKELGITLPEGVTSIKPEYFVSRGNSDSLQVKILLDPKEASSEKALNSFKRPKIIQKR